MSNNYVKKYVCGNLGFDLPSSNLIYELPLLSFADFRNEFKLSIVYNRQMATNNDNPFNLANGLKLNLQKRLIINNDDVSFQDASGKIIELTKKNNVYTFNDESQRIIRYGSEVYTLEHSDYSKEIYNSNGLITQVYDKYQDLILSYNYTGSLLTSITFRNNASKVVNFGYYNQQLTSITFSGNSDISTTFVYNSNRVQINHYSGDMYNIYYTLNNFDTVTYATENSIMHKYRKTCVIDSTNSKKAILTDYVDDTIVNTDTYVFEYDVNQVSIYSKQIETTNYYGVKTRSQYMLEKLAYSYEVKGDDVVFVNDSYPGYINTLYTYDDNYNINTRYVQKPTDGTAMLFNSQYWEYDSNKENSKTGYYIISGWIKHNTDSYNPLFNNVSIAISSGDNILNYYINGGTNKNWTYFSFKFYLNSTKIIFRSVYLEYVSFKDIKITSFIREKSNKDEYYAPLEEDILIKKADRSVVYSLNNLIFAPIDTSHGDYWVSFNDILRYKINKKKEIYNNEFYYNNNKSLYVSNQELNMEFTIKGEIDQNTNNLNDYYLGKRKYTNKGVITTTFVDDNTASFIISENRFYDGTFLSRTKYNVYMDVIDIYKDNVMKTITMDKGLNTKEVIFDLISGTQLIYETIYDESNGKIIKKDDFNENTVFYIDTTWGTTYKIEYPDGSIVNNNYDSDGKVLLNSIFGDTENTRNIIYSYEAGNTKSISNSASTYNFGYTDGKISSVSKDNLMIEEHDIYKNSTISYYPSKTNTLYRMIKNFDMYQRPCYINDYCNHVYDCSPFFDESTGDIISSVNNGSAQLAVFYDYQDDTVSRYKYEVFDRLKSIEITENNYSNKISKEEYSYNNYSQLEDISYNCQKLNQIFTSHIEYDNNEPTTDQLIELSNRIKKYNYKINTSDAAETNYEYDSFKRLDNQTITLYTNQSNNIYKRKINYNKSRILSLVNSFNSSTISNNTYTYDSLGRILTDVYTKNNISKNTRYKYDIYGQLIREDNEALNKTFVYYYDNKGNLTSILPYTYTLNESLGAPSTINTFTYDTNYKNQLNKYNNNSITYDVEGKMTEYKGFTYTWNSNRLTRISTTNISSSPNKIYDFTYNSIGQRITLSYTRLDLNTELSPIAPNEEQFYTKIFCYDNFGRIILEKKSSTLYDNTTVESQISYIYDNNSIIGIEYSSFGQTNRYYFEKNIQNDVIGIYDNNGNCLVKYYYDAWGNCTIGSETTNSDLARINPIRYRSYYYDVETNLFLVSSRYYSPELCRWISPDDIEYLDPESVNGLNLYCYCFNNPISYVDPTGHFAISTLVWILIGTAVLVTAGTITYGAVTDTPVVLDLSASFNSGAGVGYKVGISVVFDFKNDNIEFYGHHGITYGVKANTFGFSYSPGVILNYEKPGDYGGPFKNYGGGWFWGIDHCYDPRMNHSDAVQAYSITFGNNKGVYFGDDKYYYWGKTGVPKWMR